MNAKTIFDFLLSIKGDMEGSVALDPPVNISFDGLDGMAARIVRNMVDDFPSITNTEALWALERAARSFFDALPSDPDGRDHAYVTSAYNSIVHHMKVGRADIADDDVDAYAIAAFEATMNAWFWVYLFVSARMGEKQVGITEVPREGFVGMLLAGLP